ncbi:MAG: hypothetical protein PVH87_27840, partial [Desulfobacteraceae bacterium]
AATGVWTFTPANPDWFGSDTFTVTVTDDQGGTTTRVISVTLASDDDSSGTGGGDTDSGSGDDTDSDTGDDTDSDTGDDDNTELPPDEIPPPNTEVSPSVDDPDVSLRGPSTPHNTSPSNTNNMDYYVPTVTLNVSDSNFMHQMVPQKKVPAASNVSTTFSSKALSLTLDRIQQELDLAALTSQSIQDNMIIGVTTGLTVSVLAGYVIWAFRGTTLLVGALSAMPMWRCFDPLPVLLGGKKRSEEEEKEMQPEEEDAEDNVNDLLGIEQMDPSRQAVIPEETNLI